MTEELTHPAFPEDELGKLKDEMKVRILEDDDSTSSRAFTQLSRAVYPEGHPLRAHKAAERTAALDAIAVKDLRAFHGARYGGASLVVAVCGKFSAPEIEKTLEDLLRPIAKGSKPPVEAPRAPARAAERFSVPMKDKANVDIVIGNAGGLRRTDPDYYAATLANAVLGQSGLSSRLGRQVRDTEGLTYVIVSRFFSPLLIDGPWGIYLSVAPPNVDKGIASSLAVLGKFASEGISPGELEVEKSAAAGRFQVSLANNAGIADALAQSESYGLGVSLLDEYPRLVRAVTLDEANRALREHIKPDALVTVVAGSLAP
jgi:zinc protease